MTFPKHFAVSFCHCDPCLLAGFLLGLTGLEEQARRRRVCVVVLPGGLQLLRSQRGECLMAGEGKPFLAEGRIPLSGPIASLGVCVNLGVSQQQCGKEIMWLQTEENEPG